jgi:hypothetical protein
MALDLVRIARYGRADGTMSDEPERTIWSLSDGIVAGQGDGPLRPDPLPLGAVTFAANPWAADVVHAALLHLDPDRVPLLRGCTGGFRWPIAPPRRPIVRCAAGDLPPDAASERFGVDARAPSGWAGHVERVRIGPA